MRAAVPTADPAALELFVDGPLEDRPQAARTRLLERSAVAPPRVAAAVAAIIQDVAQRGDAAVRDASRRFDGVVPAAIEVPRHLWRQALEAQPLRLVEALHRSAAAIRDFHAAQVPAAIELEPCTGVLLGRRPEPLRRVGAYAPGGQAAYPSSVLMCVVPARLAGVDEVLVCSPPQANGLPAPAVMAACEIAGADRLFAIGGATAIAALAHGTETVPLADKVVGPGGVWVNEAKRQLAGRIAVDCLAGPSELLVLADGSADPGIIAAEMVAQAEHDAEALVLALLADAGLADPVRAALASAVAGQPRAATIRAALASRGGLLTCDGLEEALAFAADLAPEHLLLLLAEPRAALVKVRAAGAVFLGPASSVVFGDYTSGTNHVLPTGGQARAQSGLSVADFVRFCTYQEISPEAAAELAGPTAILAEAEGLPAHAAAGRAPSGGTAPNLRPRRQRRRPRLRDDYRLLAAYDPRRRPCEVDLSDNTNLFGTPPAAARVLARMDAELLARYPSVYGDDVKAAAAAYFGVEPECVATGCGSDDLLDSAIRAFCSPGETVVYADPTFSMIASFARMNGAVPEPVPLGEGFALDAGAVVAAAGQVTYLCRPNNPTGNLFAREAVVELADRCGGLLLIDEAYGDYCDTPLAGWAPGTGRAVVLRTMSKAFGLAGLRVGLAIGPPDLIAEIEKARGPYKVGRLAEAVASAVLRQDRVWVAGTVAEARAARRRLTARLRGLGLRAWPSEANFVLVAAPGGDAADFASHLLEAGIGVRPFPGLPQAGDCVRVTVGPWPLMERFLARCAELVTP